MHGTRGVSLNNNPDSEVIERVWRTDGLIRRDYSSRFRLSSNIHHLSAGYRAASSGYNVIIADDFDSLRCSFLNRHLDLSATAPSSRPAILQ